jgi:hypothetical protein
MESQHQLIIREILSGGSTRGPRPFGYNIVTNRSLDEVVLEFLAREVGSSRSASRCLSRRRSSRAPSRPHLRVIAEASDRPSGSGRSPSN